jgi:hypothetical protein
MTADPTLKAFRALTIDMERALGQAKLAYEFSPGSYTFSCFNACIAASHALEALRDRLTESDGGSEAA